MSLAVRLLAVVVLAWPATFGVALTGRPGTRYPSQKLVFKDPLTDRAVWRMTTDGAQRGALHLAPGDMSSEASAFSPDSASIVYAKGGIPSVKPDGVYMMDVASGVETFLAPAPWYASPVFARNGSGEVYYYDRRGEGPLVVRAVDTTTFAARTIVSFGAARWQEKIEVNADGSYIAAHPRLADGRYRTVIFTPEGAVHPKWTVGGPPSDDGALWSPADPRLICAVRDGQGKFWDITTLATKPLGCVPAHSAWHPNGQWFFTPAYLADVSTGAPVLPGTGAGPIHPNINPAEGAFGTDARTVIDDRGWFDRGTGRPRLYVQTLAKYVASPGEFRDPRTLVAVHYSSMNDNAGHIHAHWAFDGRVILWTSDVRDLRDGTPPGGAGRGTDLFVVPMAGASRESTPSPPRP